MRRFLVKRAPTKPASGHYQRTKVFHNDGVYEGQNKGMQYDYKFTDKEGIAFESTQEEFIKKAKDSDKQLTQVISQIENTDCKDCIITLIQFRFFDLTIVEIEGEGDIPKEVTDVTIMDITENDLFTDFNLADGYEK